MYYIYLAQDKDQWRVPVNTATYLMESQETYKRTEEFQNEISSNLQIFFVIQEDERYHDCINYKDWPHRSRETIPYVLFACIL
jgi:hypothetical protein